MPQVAWAGRSPGRYQTVTNILKNPPKMLHNVSGLCYYPSMNTLSEPRTNVFCSFCGSATPDFVEWADEFYCEAHCVAYLPTPEVMEQERAEREANTMARVLSALMDEVEAGSDLEEHRRDIEAIANYLDWFYPHLLDKRFQ